MHGRFAGLGVWQYKKYLRWHRFGRMKEIRVGRVLIIFCLLSFKCASFLAAETITIQAYRPGDAVCYFAPVEVLVNDVKVGLLSSGQRATWTLKTARLGRNKVTATALLLYAKSRSVCPTSEKYFSVHQDGEVVDLSLNCENFSSTKMVIRVSHEAGPMTVQGVDLSKSLKVVRIRESPPYRLAPGTEKVVEDTIRLKHEVNLSDHWKVETGVKAEVSGVWASASLEIKGMIERTTSRVYSAEIERKRSVTIRATASDKPVRVVWVLYYITGTATVLDGDKKIKVPFEMQEDFDLITESVQ